MTIYIWAEHTNGAGHRALPHEIDPTGEFPDDFLVFRAPHKHIELLAFAYGAAAMRIPDPDGLFFAQVSLTLIQAVHNHIATQSQNQL